MIGKKLILIVEDEAIIALAESTTLKKAGYDVSVAYHGEQALDMIRNGVAVDLILMDIDLGTGMDGTQAAEAILKMKDIPIVFMSSHTEPEIVNRTERITSYGYVLKSSGNTVLLTSIKMAFRLHDARRELIDRERILQETLGAMKITEDKLRQANEELAASYEEIEVSNEEIQQQNMLLVKAQQSYMQIQDDLIRAQRIAHIGSFVYLASESRVQWSEELYRILGCDPDAEAVRIEKLVALIYAEDRPLFQEQMKKLHAEGRCEFECRITKREQEIGWVSLRAEIEADKNGRPFRVTGTVQDITERKHTEKALAESQENFRLFMEYSPIYIFFKDDHIRSLHLSRNYEKMLGRPLDELIGKTMDDLFPSELAKSMIEDDKRILREGKPIEVYEQLGERYYYTLKFPITRDGGRPFLAGFTMDITDRVVAEKALKESEMKFRSLFETMTEGVAIHELIYDERNRAVDYLIIDTNPSFSRHTGIPKQEAIGKKASEVYGTGTPPFLSIYWKVVETGMPQMFETHFEPLQRDFSISAFCLGAERFATVFEDIKREEDALKRAFEEKEILMQELQHRVKNSLLLISGLVDLESTRSKNNATYETLTNLKHRILSVTKLYDLLYRSSEIREIRLDEYLKETASSLFESYAMEQKGVRLRMTMDKTHINIKRAIPMGLILNELLTNAIKHAYADSKSGRIDVSLRHDGNAMILEVSDDGKGLPEGFSKDDSKGLGLTLVHMLLEQIQGAMEIVGGRGTIFRITAPLSGA